MMMFCVQSAARWRLPTATTALMPAQSLEGRNAIHAMLDTRSVMTSPVASVRIPGFESEYDLTV